MKVFFASAKQDGQIVKFLKFEGYEILNLPKLQQADLCLFECSGESTTIGYLVQKALEMEKPVITIYLKGSKPNVFSQIKNEKFQLLEYTKSSLITQLKFSITKASLLSDKRFNFFVSSSMLAYLNSISRKLGVTKSTFIRNLIEEYRKKST